MIQTKPYTLILVEPPIGQHGPASLMIFEYVLGGGSSSLCLFVFETAHLKWKIAPLAI